MDILIKLYQLLRTTSLLLFKLFVSIILIFMEA